MKQQQNTKPNIQIFVGTGPIEAGTSRAQVGCVTSGQTSQLKVTIVVKLFNCFNAMCRNVNKQSRICGPHIFNKVIFSIIFERAWVTTYGSFSYMY